MWLPFCIKIPYKAYTPKGVCYYMRKSVLFLLLFTLLNAPGLALAQTHWLVADPIPVPRKSPLRLSLVAGDSLKAETGAEQVKLLRFALYDGKDSLDLKPTATGTTALVPAGEIKNSLVAGVAAELPATTIIMADLKGQLTKEQKALLALQDTSKWRAGVQAQEIHYAKAHIPVEGSKDKAQAHRKQLNHELEIIPQKDPSEIKAGQEMVVQVLLHQRLLPNHKLTVWHQDKTGKRTRSVTKTGTYGMRIISIKKPGTYLLHVAQKGPHQFGFSEKVTWQSLEATYVFTVE